MREANMKFLHNSDELKKIKKKIKRTKYIQPRVLNIYKHHAILNGQIIHLY